MSDRHTSASSQEFNGSIQSNMNTVTRTPGQHKICSRSMRKTLERMDVGTMRGEKSWWEKISKEKEKRDQSEEREDEDFIEIFKLFSRPNLK
jgi:hypothetical protein